MEMSAINELMMRHKRREAREKRSTGCCRSGLVSRTSASRVCLSHTHDSHSSVASRRRAPDRTYLDDELDLRDLDVVDDGVVGGRGHGSRGKEGAVERRATTGAGAERCLQPLLLLLLLSRVDCNDHSLARCRACAPGTPASRPIARLPPSHLAPRDPRPHYSLPGLLSRGWSRGTRFSRRACKPTTFLAQLA